MFEASPSPGKSSGPRLGALERKMLEQVWSRGSVTVRELVEAGNMRLAYTTIMTTLDRLFKKGLLQRSAEGKAFRYTASCSREDFPRFVAITGIRQWIESTEASTLSLSYFVDAIIVHDARLLDELRALVERKRREIRNGGRG
jgi:predicted transcriptional regulator